MNIGNLWHEEPVVISNAIAAIISIAVVFGLHITPEQKEMVVGAVGPIWLVLTIIARGKVTPNKTLEDAGLDPAVVKSQAADPAVQPFRPEEKIP